MVRILRIAFTPADLSAMTGEVRASGGSDARISSEAGDLAVNLGTRHVSEKARDEGI